MPKSTWQTSEPFGQGFATSSSSSTSQGTSSSTTSPNVPAGIGQRAFSMINPSVHFQRLIEAGSFKGYFGSSLWKFFAKKPKRSVPRSHIDRLNFYGVPIGLLVMATLITGDIFNLIPGDSAPMNCLKNPELKDEEELKMAMEYCQSANTYMPHSVLGVPKSKEARQEREIGYYHWMPLVMLLQAIMFYLPNWVWLLSDGGQEFGQVVDIARGIDAAQLVSADDETSLNGAECHQSANPKITKKGKFISLVESMTVHENAHRVTDFYMLVKLLCWANVLVQFWATDLFLGHEYRYWGVRVLIALVNGDKWTDSHIFPRFTFCDVPMHRFGNNDHTYTFRCFLRINVYIEKLYLFIWWALLFVALLTSLDFLASSCSRFLCCNSRHRTVRRLLKRYQHQLQNNNNDDDGNSQSGQSPQNWPSASAMRHFADRVIREDGALLLRFVEQYAGVDVAMALCGELFKRFEKRNSINGVQIGRRSSSGSDESPRNSGCSYNSSSDNLPEKRKAKKNKIGKMLRTKMAKLFHLAPSSHTSKHELFEQQV